jgi:exosome complex component RRP42
LDDLAHDLTALLHGTLAHPSLHPSNLAIIPGRKAWLLHLDAVIVSDAGNVLDALFIAARAALWDTKVPRTRAVEYRAGTATGGADTKSKGGRTGEEEMDVDRPAESGFETRAISKAADFELEDYWDEGEVLAGRERWPVSVTLNLVCVNYSVGLL